MDNINANTVWIDEKLIELPPDARPHSPEKLETLAADMKENEQLQEIVVVPVSSDQAAGSSGQGTASSDQAADSINSPSANCSLLTASCRYVVVAGVGRVLAARKLGWEKVRCLIKEGLSDFDKARITYAENEEREDADPFYQAAQLQKMMKAKGWSQNQLAEQLDKGKAETSRYFSLLDVPNEVKQVFQRWNTPMGHMTEILRLPNQQEKIKLAQECHDKDLSVRQLKALVDKKLGKAPKADSSHKPQADSSKLAAPSPDLVWKADKIAINRHFSPKEESKDTYIAWLSQALDELLAHPPEHKQAAHKVAQSPTETAVPPADEVVVEKIVQPVKAAAAEAETSQLAAGSSLRNPIPNAPSARPENLTPRLPQSPEEEAELLEVAIKDGPKAVYAWIYGADSPMVDAVPAKTWEELGMTPADGLRQVLEGIKQFQDAAIH
jgi:ParB/RepB/Spo0J family partition protein